jgi:hypothetical protein
MDGLAEREGNWCFHPRNQTRLLRLHELACTAQQPPLQRRFVGTVWFFGQHESGQATYAARQPEFRSTNPSIVDWRRKAS